MSDNDTTPSKTLVPPSGLVVDNPSSADGEPLFCLFTKDWLTMQTFIAQALQLPVATGDFETKYGTFTDEDAVKGCVAAMAAVQGLSADFGDPTALIKDLASNPAVLQTDTAPTQLYLHIVWFANQLYNTATTFNQTLSQFYELLSSLPPDRLQATVTEILTGNGGLQSSAVTMEGLTNDLIQAIAQFEVKLTPATDTMADYTAQSSTFYQHVKDAVGKDEADVESFQDQADAAYKLWRDLTISAVTTSVGVLVLSGGMAWPASAVLAGVLGDQAKKARDAYDKACEQRDAASADKQKKMTLQNDLGAFDRQMTPVNTAVTAFKGDLDKVLGVWQGIGLNLDFIAKNFTPDKFSGLPAWKDAMKLDDATKDWQTIAKKADEYTSNSLVTYRIINFGDPVPPPPSGN
ncbi:MAG TPA: hypothetical protein VH188_13810 [Chthoniobacterales bacterium]|jgi:hypothetical protein|nr:hypothetical protein [Chthoniobacterales bacterium]